MIFVPEKYLNLRISANTSGWLMKPLIIWKNFLSSCHTKYVNTINYRRWNLQAIERKHHYNLCQLNIFHKLFFSKDIRLMKSVLIIQWTNGNTGYFLLLFLFWWHSFSAYKLDNIESHKKIVMICSLIDKWS